MLSEKNLSLIVVITFTLMIVASDLHTAECKPHRILLDTDVDIDDIFALLYLLKLNRSEFELEGITISTNSWSDGGHAVNHVYDMLYMMGRDDISVGVGGEGGILENGTILPNVGGYLPIIEQGLTTAGYCRYRQAIPVGITGKLDVDTNSGLRKSFLPQGKRRYSPMQQATVQQVLINEVSAGPISVIALGALTNFAIFLMTNPDLKKNIEHIYIMGGGVKSKNPSGCCPKNASEDCQPQQYCGKPGNLFSDYTSNPYAEFNIFQDPLAAYQVFHSGIPVTLIPLDATNTSPINEFFLEEFENSQDTYEAQYCFKSLKMYRDKMSDDQFYSIFFMWDALASGVAVSMMRNKPQNQNGENEFAEMEYMNITVVTSNEPYGISDGSNPIFDGRKIPKFHLKNNGVHSGHVQTGLRDPFCIAKNGEGKCKDGYTEEVTGSDAVRIHVATKAKPNRDIGSKLDKEFFKSFLDVLNKPERSGKFNLTTQFPYYEEVLYKPVLGNKSLGKPVIFDMDMSAGDFLALFYLLKVPVEVIDLKAIMVTPTGWANAATIDLIYDLLHMMGRDDIPVGLGEVFAMNQTDPIFPSVGDCRYARAIPHGSGGFLDSDTLYGLARDLPRSPRRYITKSSVKSGAPRNTEHHEQQPLALETWDSVTRSLDLGSKITILTNGPLTTLAKIISSRQNMSSLIQGVYIVGGNIANDDENKGNVFSIASNKYAEFNMFLDPLAAKMVFNSTLNITLIPLDIQQKVTSFSEILKRLRMNNHTSEARFSHCLLSELNYLRQGNHQYQHMDTFLGEILGAVILADESSSANQTLRTKSIKVIAEGDESTDGQIVIDENHGKVVKILDNLDPVAYYDLFANQLGTKKQSAVVGSFDEQTRIWNTPPSDQTETSASLCISNN